MTPPRLSRRPASGGSTGERGLFVFIGSPVGQARSPALFNRAFRAVQIPADMVALHVAPEDLDGVLRSLRQVRNLRGVIITIPHKSAVLRSVARLGPEARAAGGANVLIPIGVDQWQAEMFDGLGLVAALRARGLPVRGRRVLLIGAGGAGAAIAVALRRMTPVGEIVIADPEQKRAENLAARLKSARCGPADPRGFKLVINASPCGMDSTLSPIDATRLDPAAIVCDAIMKPKRTRLLRAAARRGCGCVSGEEMLLGQFDLMWDFFGLGKTHRLRRA